MINMFTRTKTHHNMISIMLIIIKVTRYAILNIFRIFFILFLN